MEGRTGLANPGVLRRDLAFTLATLKEGEVSKGPGESRDLGKGNL